MHIEPMGTTAQFAGKPSGAGKPDYNTTDDFNRGVESIEAVAAIVEKHDGKMTVQAQSPFTSTAVKTGNSILSDLQDQGNEIGLHFHEEAHMGQNGNSLASDQWCAVMKEEISLIHQTGSRERSPTGAAGTSIRTCWKQPLAPGFRSTATGRTRTPGNRSRARGHGALAPGGQHQWNGHVRLRPAQSGRRVVFLPEGNYDKADFAASRRSDVAGGDEAYFVYLKDQLLRSINTAQAGKVERLPLHRPPGRVSGSVTDQFGVIDRFLTEVVDPLVKSGEVKWATFSEMAAAHETWERRIRASTRVPGRVPRPRRPRQPLLRPTRRSLLARSRQQPDGP